MRHYITTKFQHDNRSFGIAVVGAGGTGSIVVTHLARINYALLQMGVPGIHVMLYDPELVESHNVGRQMFSPSDVGKYKTEVLITRINRFYGFQWMSYPKKYKNSKIITDIIISCVDSIKSRSEIKKSFFDSANMDYWIDTGNDRDHGQILIGTNCKVKQSDKKGVGYLPNFFNIFPKAKDDLEEPSCSMAESLTRQDLFINTVIGIHTAACIWDLLTKPWIDYRGLYINLKSKNTKPIPIEKKWQNKKFASTKKL